MNGWLFYVVLNFREFLQVCFFYSNYPDSDRLMSLLNDYSIWFFSFVMSFLDPKNTRIVPKLSHPLRGVFVLTIRL
jgi:hypothetical protein